MRHGCSPERGCAPPRRWPTTRYTAPCPYSDYLAACRDAENRRLDQVERSQRRAAGAGVYLSYSRRDQAAVRTLIQHLQRAGESVWLDEMLTGGEAWWDTILNRIRSCTVFVVVLSDNWLQSKPCRTEMEYASALGVPIVPVQVGDVPSYRHDPYNPILTTHMVDFRNPDAKAAAALIGALHAQAAMRKELPDPLPPPPPIPFEFLLRLDTAIRSSEQLSLQEQQAILAELRMRLEDEQDDSVRNEILELSRALRRRADVYFGVVREIDAILVQSTDTPSAAATPPTRFPEQGTDENAHDEETSGIQGPERPDDIRRTAGGWRNWLRRNR